MVVIASELYWPETTSTGRYLTQIAEGMAERAPVRVLCGQPTYAARGTKALAHERRSGVEIRRVRSTTLDKNRLLPRFVNALTLSASMLAGALRFVPRGATVMAVTNPPLLPFVMALAARVKGARFVLLVHDVYPDALHAVGLAGERSVLTRAFGALNRWLYRSADGVVVLGRDMQQRVAPRLPAGRAAPAIIPHWMDENVAPVPRAGNPLLRDLGLDRAFVAQYAGNMGRSHDLDLLVDAAAELPEPFALLLIGWGARRGALEETVHRRGLANVRVLDPRPVSELNTVLGACDVALVSFVAGMSGVSVPSRMYNIMAAGRPIVAVTEADSELARVVREEEIGWVVAPGDRAGLVAALREAQADPARLAAMGARARAAAVERYTLEQALPRYAAALGLRP